jgi:putative exosortase-associated protein (TIGR04073 family)
MRNKFMMAVLALCMAVPVMAWAGENFEAFNLEEINYENSAVNKLGRGLINTATFWVEIPGRVAQVSAEENPLLGVTLGGAEGTFNALVRGVSGVFDTVTCAFPPYDQPVVLPEYALKSADQHLTEWLW